jgi:hypothetical protein
LYPALHTPEPLQHWSGPNSLIIKNKMSI